MTPEERNQQQKNFAAWRKTEIGNLFERYDAAIGNAWVVDSTSSSTRRMKEEWAKADAARTEFLNKVCKLAGVENPYA